MTVSATYSPPQYTGNGTTTAFGFPFNFFAPADLVVNLFDTTANANISPQPVLNGAGTYDYTISGTQDVNTGEYLSGGTITFRTAPLANHRVTITRNVASTQPNVYTNNSAFPAKTVEGSLDRATMLVQQCLALIATAITIPASDGALAMVMPPAGVRKNTYLGFDSSGLPTALVAPSGSAPVSSAMAPVVAAASLAAAQAAMGLGSAAILTAGTGANDALQLDGSGNLPAISGKNLIGVPASGFVNKLRNSSLTAWYHGTSPFNITTSGGWGPEGVYVVPSGATISVQQVVNPLSNPLTVNAFKINGAPSNTDVMLRFVIESYDAAPLAGQTVTVQFPLLNQSGATLTPKLTVRRPTAQDNYGSIVTDVSAVNLQSIANNATGIAAYTFSANASSFNGLSIDLDLGNMPSGAIVYLGGGFDCRATPGISTGLNASPPPPEIPTIAADAAWNQRFFWSTYNNGVAPGNAGQINAGDAQSIFSGVNDFFDEGKVTFPVRMRVTPSMTAYNPSTGASGTYWDYSASSALGTVGTRQLSDHNANIYNSAGSSTAGHSAGVHLAFDATLTGA